MALQQITFNIGAFNDSNAGGNNYYPNTVFQVKKQSDNTFASIYSDPDGSFPISQNGIDNISNSVGECVFYIGAGEYYIEVDSKIKMFNTGSLQTLYGLNDFSELNKSVPRNISVETIETESADVGTMYKLDNATYMVVSSSESGGIYRTNIDGGKKLKLIIDGDVTTTQIGLSLDDSTGVNNSSKLASARDVLIDSGVSLIFDNKGGTNYPISEAFQFVRDSDGASLRIHSSDGGGLLRMGVLSNSVDVESVLTVGVRSTFIHGFSVTGGIPLRFSAATGTDGKLPNRRGRNTACMYLGNCYDFVLEAICAYGEKAVQGKSVFNGEGYVHTQWCHKGWELKPLTTGSAGSACTSLYFKSNFDFTIHPYDIDVVVYSNFKGYAQAVRQAYAHYEADEISIFLRDEGIASVGFDYGIEAFQGMFRYNKTTPSYMNWKLRAELGPTAENHFERSATRTSNITYGEQAYFSMGTVGTLSFLDSQLSGSTVTISTDDTPLFHKPNKQCVVSLQGGFIEAGSSYTMKSDTTEWLGTECFGTRFDNGFINPDGNESVHKIGNSLYKIDLGDVPIQADGTIEINRPSGYLRIISADGYVIRSTSDLNNLMTLVSASDTQWIFKTGLTSGFSAKFSIVCTG